MGLYNFPAKGLGDRSLDRIYLLPGPQMGRPTEHATLFLSARMELWVGQD